MSARSASSLAGLPLAFISRKALGHSALKSLKASITACGFLRLIEEPALKMNDTRKAFSAIPNFCLIPSAAGRSVTGCGTTMTGAVVCGAIARLVNSEGTKTAFI